MISLIQPGVDDVIALLLLLASPEIHLEAITVCFGTLSMCVIWDSVLIESTDQVTRMSSMLITTFSRPTIL